KSAGSQQSGIEHIGPIRRGDDNDSFLSIESVHLHEERIERLLTLVITTAKSVPATAAHGVNFINKDQTGCILTRLFKHIADATRADAHEHFNKIGAADAEKRGIRLPGDGFGQKRLSGSRLPNHQNALRN